MKRKKIILWKTETISEKSLHKNLSLGDKRKEYEKKIIGKDEKFTNQFVIRTFIRCT